MANRIGQSCMAERRLRGEALRQRQSPINPQVISAPGSLLWLLLAQAHGAGADRYATNHLPSFTDASSSADVRQNPRQLRRAVRERVLYGVFAGGGTHTYRPRTGGQRL